MRNLSRLCALLGLLLAEIDLHAAQEESSAADNSSTIDSGTDSNTDSSANSTANDHTSRNRFIEEIVVTAQKREQNDFDVPIAITAHSGEFLKDLGVDNFAYLSSFVPGLSIQEQSVNNSGFVIRGITSDEVRATQNSRVSIYQDGVDISQHQGSNVAFFDMARVEILKGPQGTLFGRGAQIGAISLISNRARDETSGEVRYTTGNFNENTVEAYYNAPLVEDTLFARMAVIYKKRDGYIDNLAGGTLNGVDTRALRLSLGARPSDNTQVDVIFNHENNQPPGTAFESFFFPPDDPFESVNLDLGNQLKVDREIYSLTAIVDHKMNDSWTLVSTTGYREYASFEMFDADGMELPILALKDIAEHEQWSQELRFNFEDGGKFHGFVGTNIFHKNGFESSPAMMSEQYLIDFPKLSAEILGNELTTVEAPVLYNADGSPFPRIRLSDSLLLSQFAAIAGDPLLNPAILEEQINKGKTFAIDIFIDGTYDLTEKLSITTGIRVTHEEIESRRITPLTDSQAGIAPLINAVNPEWNGNFVATPAGSDIKEDATNIGVVGRLVANYLVNANVNTYTSYARGRRPDAIDFSNRSDVFDLQEEIVDSYEFGAKYESDSKEVTLESAIFYYDYSNFQTQFASDSIGYDLEGSGEASTKGAELSGTALITETLSIFYNAAYIDSQVDDDPEFKLAGHRFRLTSEWTGAFGASYRNQVAEIGTGFVNLTYTFKSDLFFEDDNESDNGVNREGAVGLTNLKIGLVSLTDEWETGLFVNNIFGKEYIIDAGNVGSFFGVSTFIPGPPRFYGANFVWRF